MHVFSTCWNSKNHKDGYAMCEEIRALGFSHIELSHGLSITLVPGVLKALEEGLIQVAGVHNFCPSPVEVKGDSPDIYQMTSHREWERSRALRLTEQSIDFATRVKAQYIVLHMGRIHLFQDNTRTKQLEQLAKEGQIGSKAYAKLKGSLMQERAKCAPIYFERARQALHQLAEYASKYSLRLGVEGRSHFEQIPSEEEALRLFEEFADCPQIGYWHDFAHIQRQHNLLLLNHQQFLEGLKEHIIGAHINDVQWPARDHLAPLRGSAKGGVDFANLLPRYFTADMPLTWELSRSVKAQVIQDAKPKWDALCERMTQSQA